MVDYKYSELFTKNSVDKQLKITANDGSVTITNKELHSQQFELTESLCSESELKFGSCEAGMVKFRISNVFTPLKGKWLTITSTLAGNTDKPFRFGSYKVESDKPTADRRYRDVVAYDALYDVMIADVTAWYNTVFPSHKENRTDEDGKTTTVTVYTPVTMKQFRNSFFAYFGIEQADVVLVNDSMLVEKTVGMSASGTTSSDTEEISVIGESMNGQKVLSCICEINGCMGHIGRDGKFHYIYLKQDIKGLYPANDLYPSNNLYPKSVNTIGISKSGYISCEYEDYVTQRIGRLQIRQEENDIGAISGNGGNCYIIEDNFLVYGKSAADLKTIADNIFAVIGGISYRPYSAKCVGNPCLEVGDAIRLVTKYELVESYILKRTLQGIQALRDEFAAEGSEVYSEKNSVNREIIRLKGRTNTLERNVEETISAIADTEEKLSSRIAQTAKSIELSVNNESTSAVLELTITNEDGSKTTVTSDKIELKGLVSFLDLENSGSTNINGNNITTGVINTEKVCIGDKLTMSTEQDGQTATRVVLTLDWPDGQTAPNIVIGGASKVKNTVIQNATRILGDFDSENAAYFRKNAYFGEQSEYGCWLDVNGNVYANKVCAQGGAYYITTSNLANIDILGYDYDNGRVYVGNGNKELRIRGTAISSAHEITTSDERLKNSFKSLDEFDSVYMELEPCAFRYNDGTSGRSHFGFKAQNVRDAFLNNGFTMQDFAGFAQMSDNPASEEYSGVPDPMGLRYPEFISWNTHMIQNLYRTVETQRTEIDALKQSVSFLTEKLGGNRNE